MARERSHFSPLLFLCAAIALSLNMGCAPKPTTVNGSMFVVTKGRMNVKLALVTVAAYDEATVKEHVKAVTDSFKARGAALKADLDKSAEMVAEAHSAMRSAESEFNFARELADEVDAKLKALSPMRPENAPNNIVTQWDSLKAQRDKWLAEKEAAEGNFRVKQVNWRTLSREQESLRARLSAESSAESLTLTFTEELFGSLPQPKLSAKTDADGKFSLQVPGKGRYALAATAKRDILGSTENYYWLVWLPSDSEGAVNSMLSNDNQIGSDSADSVVSLTEFAGALQDEVTE